MDVMEDGSYFGSGLFSPLEPMLPMNSYLIAGTYSQSCTEEGEHCAFSILLAHLALLFHHLLEADPTSFQLEFWFLGSKFQFQDYQVSFGFDLKKFKFGEHLHLLFCQSTLVALHGSSHATVCL